MKKKDHKVLVVAPSRKTRGGITSVVKAHEKGEQWETYHCIWIGASIDRNTLLKLLYLCQSIIIFLIEIWTTSLVHIHMSTIKSARRKAIFVNLALLLRKRIIIHFHASPTTSLDTAKSIESYPKFYRNLFIKADKIIVLSKSSKEKLYEYTGLKNNVEIVFNPCPIIETNKYKGKEKSILIAGKVSFLKGYEVIIRAFAQIAHKYPDWSIKFAGNGEIEKAKDIAIECKISDQTFFLGWITGEEKDTIFKKCSFLCLPSYTEGMPMAVLDAWAYGLPVVASEVGGIIDMIQDGYNGLTFKAGDIDSLSQKLDLMISNENIRNHFSKISFELSQSLYNAKTINQKIGNIYNQLLNKAQL